jgi:hypothetical protein
MCRGLEMQFLGKYMMDVLLPETRSFWMSLERMAYWEDMTFQDGLSLLMLHPPFSELIINDHIEWLDRWRCFRERIASIRTHHNKALTGGQTPV